MAKRPNGGSCLIRFETQIKLGRGRERESPLWSSKSRSDQPLGSANGPPRPADIVLQSFNTVSLDAQSGAGVTERLMRPTADRFPAGSTRSPGTSPCADA